MNELSVRNQDRPTRQNRHNQCVLSEKVMVNRRITVKVSPMMLVLLMVMLGLALIIRGKGAEDIQVLHLKDKETAPFLEPREASPPSQRPLALENSMPSKMTRYIRTTGCVNVRSQPNLDGVILTDIAEGSSVEYLGRTAIDSRGVKWYLVQTKYTGTVGWVSSRYAYLG